MRIYTFLVTHIRSIRREIRLTPNTINIEATNGINAGIPIVSEMNMDIESAVLDDDRILSTMIVNGKENEDDRTSNSSSNIISEVVEIENWRYKAHLITPSKKQLDIVNVYLIRMYPNNHLFKFHTVYLMFFFSVLDLFVKIIN